jgi:hypothetical protein
MSTEIRKKISNKYCPRFGQIAVEMGFITIDQLKYVMSMQIDDNFSGEEHRFLGTILFEIGWMSSDQIDVVLTLVLKPTRSENESKETNP